MMRHENTHSWANASLQALRDHGCGHCGGVGPWVPKGHKGTWRTQSAACAQRRRLCSLALAQNLSPPPRTHLDLGHMGHNAMHTASAQSGPCTLPPLQHVGRWCVHASTGMCFVHNHSLLLASPHAAAPAHNSRQYTPQRSRQYTTMHCLPSRADQWPWSSLSAAQARRPLPLLLQATGDVPRHHNRSGSQRLAPRTHNPQALAHDLT